MLYTMDSEVSSIPKQSTQLFWSSEILATKFILRSSFYWTCTSFYTEYLTSEFDSKEDFNPLTKWDGQCKSVRHFHQSFAFGSLNQLLTQTSFISARWWAWSSIWLCFMPFLLSSGVRVMLVNTWTCPQMVSSYIADECNPNILLISSFISILT